MGRLISVIVPVYNVEAYLDKCVASLVGQTYRELEILLVDDGSTDQSGALCDAWAAKDSRIRVIHKPNGGLSDARNAGVAAATGDYIGFVDSDDWVEPRMYELLMDALSKQQADIAECRWAHFSDEKPAQPYDDTPFAEETMTAEQALIELIAERKLRQTVVNKLYDEKIVKKIPFEVGKINEDEFWTYQIFGEMTSLVYLDVALYHYYQRSGSIMHTSYSPKRLQGLEAYEARMNYMQSRFPTVYPAAVRAYLSACLFHYQTICRQASIDADGALRADIIKHFRAVDQKDFLSSMRPKHRMWIQLFGCFPRFTCRVRNFLKIGL
ncbi:MAG: glycosyltransferase [Acutalibacteraceae bacterium]